MKMERNWQFGGDYVFRSVNPKNRVTPSPVTHIEIGSLDSLLHDGIFKLHARTKFGNFNFAKKSIKLLLSMGKLRVARLKQSIIRSDKFVSSLIGNAKQKSEI